MYRQIEVVEPDRTMQKILWRKSSSEKFEEYELGTITYGTGPASFIATKCLEIIGKELASQNSLASKMILENFYMDDLITEHDNLETLLDVQQVIHKKLGESHFPLRKYLSNSSTFLNSLNQGRR